MLRAGATGRVLPFKAMAASTVGTFLRGFTFGHVRQLDAVASRALARAWQAGAGPSEDELLTVDLDSTVCEVYGHGRGAAGYGYTGKLGYHPLLAARADTGEILFARMLRGSANTARGAPRFVSELAGVLKRAGARGPVTLRADSGFWSHKLCGRLDALGIQWSITARQNSRVRAAIGDNAWQRIGYTPGGEAQVAETAYTAGQGKAQRQIRLVVRRTRLAEPAQRRLWPNWRHHAFITNRCDLDAVEADAYHRAHARVELAIRDLKDSGLQHVPSGHYWANAAWLACAALAHNIGCWTTLLAGRPKTTSRTLRTRIIALPAALANRSGRHTLRLPARWPWAHEFEHALKTLRALPGPSP